MIRGNVRKWEVDSDMDEDDDEVTNMVDLKR